MSPDNYLMWALIGLVWCALGATCLLALTIESAIRDLRPALQAFTGALQDLRRGRLTVRTEPDPDDAPAPPPRGLRAA